MLREPVGRPGLEVDAELARVGAGGGALLEVTDGDGCSEEEEGLGGFEVAVVARSGLRLASRRMTVARSSRAATYIGVAPFLAGVSTLAPSLASSLTISRWPSCAAMQVGVAPSFLGVSTLAPA